MAGKLWVHVILLFTTAGVGNVIYYFWAKEDAEEAISDSGIQGEQVLHDTRPVIIWPLKSPTTSYIITDHRVVLEKGVLNKRSVEQQVSDIRQITTGATWLERLQGYGHIEVETHDGAAIRLKSIPNYGTVADTIRGAQAAG